MFSAEAAGGLFCDAAGKAFRGGQPVMSADVCALYLTEKYSKYTVSTFKTKKMNNTTQTVLLLLLQAMISDDDT